MQLSSNGNNPFLEQAALWAVVLEKEDTPEHRAAFAMWLTRAPEHVEATLLLTAAVYEAEQHRAVRWKMEPNETIGDIAQIDTTIVEVMRLGAVKSSTQGAVSSLNGNFWRRPSCWVAACIIALILVAIFAHIGGSTSHQPSAIQRQIAQRSMSVTNAAPAGYLITSPSFVRLGPASLLRVDNHTRVRVVISPNGRGSAVRVLDGAAYFSGQHTSAQQLLVFSGHIVIQDVGTRFSVRNEHGRTEISVFDGTVRFTCKDVISTSASALFDVGSAQVIQTGVFLKRNALARLDTNDCNVRPDIRTLSAGSSNAPLIQDGWVSFHNTPVKTAAESFNRANAHYLFVVDNAVAKQTLGGRFKVSEVDAFLRALSELGIRAVPGASTPDGTVIYLTRAH